MFKFLRKYNKVMLAFFGVLLMITFLIPQAFNKFASQQGATGAVVANIGDREVFTAGQLTLAQRELNLLEKTSPQIIGLLELLKVKNPEHWFLLVREANAAGLIGTPRSVDISEEELLMLMQMTGEHEDFVRSTLANFFGVRQLANLYATGGLYSDRRLRSAAEDLMHQATVQMIVFESSADKANSEPTEEQIREHFEKHRNDDAIDGGFGYKLPDRVKLEWIKIPLESIREIARASEQFNGVSQRLHWRRFATDKTKNFPPVQDTGAIPDVVKDDLLEKLSREQADQITTDAVNRLSMNRRGLNEQAGYVVLPSDWHERKISFQTLAQDLQKKYSIALPEFHSSGDWTPVAEVGKLEGIGTASTDRFGATPIRFNQLIEAAKEFEHARTAVPIQKDIAGPPLKGSDGSVYLFRILDADAARAPNSVDEVRDRVIADLKRKAHFDQLVQQAPQLEEKAESQGLMAMAVENDTPIQRAQVSMTDQFALQQMMQYNLPPSLEPAPLPVVGRSREINQAIIDYVRQLPADKLPEELSEQQRTWVLPAPDKLAVLVLRLIQNYPLTQERFTQLTQQSTIQNLVSMKENIDSKSVADAFSFDTLAKRHNFKMVRDEENPAEPEAQASAAK